MGVEPPHKYVNRELNSQIGIRGQNSHFSQSDVAPPTSMLLWGAIYCVRYVKRDANDSLCSSAAPDCTSKTESSTTQLA